MKAREVTTVRQDVYDKDLAAYLEEMGYRSIPGWQERLREMEQRSRARLKVVMGQSRQRAAG
jgi:hypothetical protein